MWPPHLQGALLPAAGREAGVGALAGPHPVPALDVVPEQLRLAQPCARAQHHLGALHRTQAVFDIPTMLNMESSFSGSCRARLLKVLSSISHPRPAEGPIEDPAGLPTCHHCYQY